MSAESVLSVGIDIGTSTTQVVFSRLTLEDTAGYFSVPRVSIVDKQVIYAGEIYRTPLLDAVRIDAEAVKALVAREYVSAGWTPADVSTGAVIITGESARKENARAVLDRLSEFAGEFVVSTAGPDLEAVIAGKGSGAWQHSLDTMDSVINIDIGGGTSNIVEFYCGDVLAKGCLDIGGRQVCFSQEGILTYVSPSAGIIADALDLDLRTGQPAEESALRSLCRTMADLLFEWAAGQRSELLKRIETAGSTPFLPPREGKYVFFSGGVGKCLHASERDTGKYGDIGVLLAQALRESRFFQRFTVVESRESIRATVVGAGSYTTTVSGSTIFYSEPLFPQQNLPVLKLTPQEQEKCFEGSATELAARIQWFLEQVDGTRMVLGLPGVQDPGYEALKRMASSIAGAAGAAMPKDAPLFIVIESDTAKALGQVLFAALGRARPVVVIDAIHVEQNDYVDLGKPLMNGLVIPVIVKTLIFG